MADQPKKLHGCVKALLIFFYPFGLVYLCYWLTKRMASDPANYKKDSIAAIAGVTTQQAITDVQKLIDANALEGAYIDRRRGKIVIPSRQIIPPQPPRMDQRPRVSVVCPHCCGANRIIPDQKNICDYCDMPIEN